MGFLLTPEFLSMVIGIIVSLLVAVVPQFESVKAELITVVTVLVGLVISALGLERAAAARSSGLTQAEKASVKSYSGPTVVKSPPTP